MKHKILILALVLTMVLGLAANVQAKTLYAVQCTAAQTDVVRGEAFNAGSSLRVHFDAGVYSTVSFDYKFTGEDGVMQFALLDSNGSLYYGRFKVNATGEEGSYNGVEVKALSDGYYRVTVTISEVTDSNGTPADLMTLYIRGSGTTASGYVDNLQAN